MRTIIYALVLTTVCVSCKKESYQNNNVLLPNNVEVFSFEPTPNTTRLPKEWVAGLNMKPVNKGVLNRVNNNYFPVYSPNRFFYLEGMPVLDYDSLVNDKLEFENDINIFFERVLFHENWELSQDFSRFTKKTLGWFPVEEYTVEEGQDMKKLSFYVIPEKQTKGKKIGQDIFTEFYLFNQKDNYFSHFSHIRGFDHLSFVEKVLEGIDNGTIDAYDPIYMVDKTKRTFTIDSIYDYALAPPQKVKVREKDGSIGERIYTDQLNPREEITSVLFHEDWYFDEETLSIYKDVKALGFIRNKTGVYENSDYKILFFITFD